MTNTESVSVESSESVKPERTGLSQVTPDGNGRAVQ
jgi:hypothetical protein